MKIGVISDIHDRVKNLNKAVDQLIAKGCGRIICLGDIESPNTLESLVALAPALPIDMVPGNNDFDTVEFETIARNTPLLTLHGFTGELEVDSVKMAFTHMPETAIKLAETGNYDYVFYGHTHRADQAKLGGCTLCNPGEIMARTGTIGYGILDTALRQFTLYTLQP